MIACTTEHHLTHYINEFILFEKSKNFKMLWYKVRYELYFYNVMSLLVSIFKLPLNVHVNTNILQYYMSRRHVKRFG